MPWTMILNEESGENGEYPISFELIFYNSTRSLLIVACSNSLCCSDVEYERLVNSALQHCTWSKELFAFETFTR